MEKTKLTAIRYFEQLTFLEGFLDKARCCPAQLFLYRQLHIRLKRSENVGYEEAQNELFASFRHHRHLYHKIKFNLDEAEFSLSHQEHYDAPHTIPNHGGASESSTQNLFLKFGLVQRLKFNGATDLTLGIWCPRPSEKIQKDSDEYFLYGNKKCE
ncbi:hypothetical protein J6590_042200 [Homalodisca vitripennis]|nr:hypothetical protein J6590_042200 [Homalodisca vitripennis]